MLCPRWDSNPHGQYWPGDFKSPVSTIPPFLHQDSGNADEALPESIAKIIPFLCMTKF